MNENITPKVKETIPGEKITISLDEIYRYIEKNFDLASPKLAFVGIQTRGAVLADRLAAMIRDKKDIQVPVGALDITLYRDDFSTKGIQPIVKETVLNFDINDKQLLLIDDVLFTGRTVRAALDELMDYGRPKSIHLLVLVDRGHRELPIEAQLAPIKISTKRNESVNLHLTETDGKDEIVICEPLDE